ncbi:MAG: hypothetical protein M1115_07885 [Actinobacteria bacterium]|nr:hypothetical protein [Actinomycetota bacterium]
MISRGRGEKEICLSVVLNPCLGRVLKVRPARQVYPAAYKLKVLAELETADSKSDLDIAAWRPSGLNGLPHLALTAAARSAADQ